MSTNSLQISNKINHLLMEIPDGVVIPMQWLNSNGYSRQLVNRYVKSGRLMRFAHGSYYKAGQVPDWQGVVLGLQLLKKQSLHIGGITALNNLGLAHYLPVGEDFKTVLFGDKFPSWLKTDKWKLNKNKLFGDENKTLKKLGLIQIDTSFRDWKLISSGAERAILEVSSQIDASERDFVMVSDLLEGLLNLRPKVLQQLLEKCTSIKAIRVFLFLANYHQMPWFNRLDLTKINCGSGKRQIVKNGRYDTQFKITVPDSFMSRTRESSNV